MMSPSKSQNGHDSAHPQDTWRIFERVYPTYDSINRILSLGMDLKWRRKLARLVVHSQSAEVLDLATGTADVLFLINQACPGERDLYGLDMSQGMLSVAQRKLKRQRRPVQMSFVRSDAVALPFLENKFDAVTMAFGIRNLKDPPGALKEMFRVLRPQGHIYILEFSLPENRFVRSLALVYLRICVPLFGGLCSGHWKAYQYLSRSVEVFPYGQNFCRWVRDAGFSNIRVFPVLWGMASIYQARKE